MDVVSFDAANAAASGSVAAAPSAAAGSSAASIADPRSPAAPSAPGSVDQGETLHKLVSQFFGGSSSSDAPKQTISVSFQVATQPNEIVTVFRDSKTNEVVAQFPPEIMVRIAEFFNKLSGATLDQKV